LRSIVVGQRGLQLCERHLDVDNLDLLGLRLAQLLLLLLVGEVGLLAPVGVLLLVVLLLLLLRLRVVGAGETRGEQERGRRQEQRERQACFGLREVGRGEKRRRGGVLAFCPSRVAPARGWLAAGREAASLFMLLALPADRQNPSAKWKWVNIIQEIPSVFGPRGSRAWMRRRLPAAARGRDARD